MKYEEFVEKFKSQNKYKLKSSKKDTLEHDVAVNLLESKGKDFVLGANLVKNEYGHALFADYFFFITGFHGFHVIIGTIFLAVCLLRGKLGHFNKDHHFGFEAAAWYWHFVDVVWLFLFAAIYVWGS